MSRLVAGLIAALALTGFAAAQEAGRLSVISLDPRQRQMLPISGATAAYSLDPGVADVVLQDGVPTIVAMAPGTASVVIVTPAGMQYASVVVRPSDEALSSNGGPGSVRLSTFETQYDSFSRRLQNVITAATQTGDRITSMRLNYTLLPGGPGRHARHVIPAASYRIADRRSELVFLDDLVRSSPLTLDGQMVRGIHFRRSGLQLHAGYSSFAFFNNLLLSRQRNAMIGADYRVALNEVSGVTPRLYIFPTRNSTRGNDGVVASVGYDYRRGPELQIAAELGASRRLSGGARLTPGGYLDVSHSSVRDNASLRVLYQPDGFATLNSALHGLRSDGVWVRRISSLLTSTLSFDANRYRFATFQQTNEDLNLGLRRALGPEWFISSGARYSHFDSRTSHQPAVRSYELPVGVEYVTPRLSTALEYRYTRSSVSEHAGNGVRASVRARSDNTTFDLYLDRRTQVPTLDLIFTENPGLDLALRQLGLVATTPTELARLLREHPELVNFDAIRGVNVNISPIHYELGSSLWWTGKGVRDARVGITTSYARDVAPSRTRQSALAGLAYSVMLTNSLNLGLQYSRFFSHSGSGAWAGVGGWQISFRQQFNDFPSPSRLFARRGTIEGIVFADPDESGLYDPTKPGIAGAEVLLDDVTETSTTAEGRFHFDRVPVNDAHHVEVRYQSKKPFHFTSAPKVSAGAGKLVTFGIGPIAGHLTVWVRSTEQLPIANVRVSVSDGHRSFIRETAEGKAAIDVAHAGVYEVSLNAESIPSGYLLVDAGPRSVTIEEGHPDAIEFRLKAMRSVGGRVRGGDGAGAPIPGAMVLLDAGASTSTTDAHGTYLFRDVSPGAHVISAMVGGNQVRREIEIPSAPGALRDVDLVIQGAVLIAAASRAEVSPSGRPHPAALPALRPASISSVSSAASATSIPPGFASATVPAPEAATSAHPSDWFSVQIGVFRQRENVRRAVRDAERANFPNYTTGGQGELVVVSVGPFATRAEADDARRHLSERNIDGMVVSTRNRGRKSGGFPKAP